MNIINEPRKFDIKPVLNGLPVKTKSGGKATFIAYLKGVPAPLLMCINGEFENYFEDGTSGSVSKQDDTLVNIEPIDWNLLPSKICPKLIKQLLKK